MTTRPTPDGVELYGAHVRQDSTLVACPPQSSLDSAILLRLTGSRMNRATEDWEQFVAFIRLEFPSAQRDMAQQLAIAFAGLVGRAIATLSPEHTIEQIVSPIAADSLDAREFVAAVLERQGIATGGVHRFETWTFRELVEYAHAASS